MKKAKLAKKDRTKAELISAITAKTRRIPARFQPAVKHVFIAPLKYATITRLRRILSNMKIRVDKTGWDIYTP